MLRYYGLLALATIGFALSMLFKLLLLLRTLRKRYAKSNELEKLTEAEARLSEQASRCHAFAHAFVCTRAHLQHARVHRGRCDAIDR